MNDQGSSKLPLKLLILSCVASGLIFFITNGSPLCFLPIVLYAAFYGLKAVTKRSRPDQDILLGFLILSFFVDDISQVAWGRTIDTWTEAAGALLFRSFGISGMEAFALILSLWLIITRLPHSFRAWYQAGFVNVMVIALGVFLCSLGAGLFGTLDGGDINTMFIQIRFLYLLPLWVFIGFGIWRDREFSQRALKWITIMIAIKSFQALYVYFTHYQQYRTVEEYLVDHYFSGFSVVAMICLCAYLISSKNWPLRLLIVTSMAAVGLAYIFNDRRTSYVGVAFGLAVLPTLLPFKLIKKYMLHGLALATALLVFTIASWNIEGPIGFIGNTYRSFGAETGLEEPSYRDLENANLLHAVSQNPSAGLGYGKEFEEVFPMPDISFVYARYRMIPHNLFLATWAFGGPLTMAALSALFVTMIASAGKLLQKSREPGIFLLGVVSLFYFLQYFTYTFGDLGFQIQRNQMMAGLLLGACFRIYGMLDEEIKDKESSWL